MIQVTERQGHSPLHSERRHCDSLSKAAIQSASVMLKHSCSLSHTKSIISFSFSEDFLDQLLCFVRRSSSFHLFHVKAFRQCTFVQKRERTRDNTDISKFRWLKGKGIILLIKSALIYRIGPLCFHPPTMLQEISFIVSRCVDSGP